MSFTFKCPRCGNDLQAEDSWAGQQTTCPRCSQQITIPYPNVAASTPNVPAGATALNQSVTPVNLGMATAALVFGILSFLCVPLCGIVALILGIIALSKIKNSNGVLLGHGKAVTGIVFGCWSILRFPVLAILAAMILPALSKAREKAQQISCVNNLKQITLAVAIFAEDHNDHIPNESDIPDKLIEYLGDEKTMHCPLGDTYRLFVNGATVGSFKNPSQTIIAVCPHGHCNHAISVAFLDGHVESITNDAVKVHNVIDNCPKGELPVLESTGPRY